jgi:hypothetical protein
MRRIHWLLAGLALAIGAGALAQVVPGGLPQNPRFQSVTITNTGAGSFTQFALNATQSTSSNYIALNNAGVTKGVLLNERTASGNCSNDAVDDICLRSISGRIFGSDSTGSGWITLEQSSGALTWVFNAATSPNCNATGTNATIQLHRFGRIVEGAVTSGGSCTSVGTGNITTNNTPVPAQFRPTQALTCGTVWIQNQTGLILGQICVSSAGNFQVNNPASVSNTLLAVNAQTNFVYSLD